MYCDVVDKKLRYTICAPMVLSAVCRMRRVIAYVTPKLWTTLPLLSQVAETTRDTLPTTSFVKEWIKRAGQLPLSIITFASYHDSKR
ncbi:hypothetical protein BDN70DRAFT_58091 [Pholiota conissans]|uniref:Uncharacterized protein n=1 Tax=Pholiota conissans TaxID=109636 RepID=A0A9P6CY51_9AGAR|nr:hypothetical protein BDN70DRAFT_58091 [Pholiota conissans]